MLPSFTMSAGYCASIVSFANSIGSSASLAWNSFTRPGWPTAARSGGLPPSMAVESTVGVLSPAEVYLTFTLGYFSSNASSTAWKDSCSLPVQMPMTERLPLTEASAVVMAGALSPEPDSSSSPQADRVAARVAAASAATSLLWWCFT